MKGGEHMELKQLVSRLEGKRRQGELVTTAIAALGLIGFGIMIVPILGEYHSLPQVASIPVATSSPVSSAAFADVPLTGQAAVVYDLSTGKVLFEKNGEEQLPLASLTKLLTTYAAVTTMDPNAPVTISETALAQDGDSGLSAGETFALKDIARFALVASSNDAAEAIAETAAQKKATDDRGLLAAAAEAVGLTRTYANNGTGLDVNTKISGGYGSAEDVAILAGALLKQAPAIAHATTLTSVSAADYAGNVHTLPNTNQEIVTVPSPLLSKTGYTDLAGGNLVVVFDAGINHPVAAVVLGSTRDGRFSDVETLVSRTLDYFGNVAP